MSDDNIPVCFEPTQEQIIRFLDSEGDSNIIHNGPVLKQIDPALPALVPGSLTSSLAMIKAHKSQDHGKYLKEFKLAFNKPIKICDVKGSYISDLFDVNAILQSPASSIPISNGEMKYTLTGDNILYLLQHENIFDNSYVTFSNQVTGAPNIYYDYSETRVLDKLDEAKGVLEELLNYEVAPEINTPLFVANSCAGVFFDALMRINSGEVITDGITQSVFEAMCDKMKIQSYNIDGKEHNLPKRSPLYVSQSFEVFQPKSLASLKQSDDVTYACNSKIDDKSYIFDVGCFSKNNLLANFSAELKLIPTMALKRL